MLKKEKNLEYYITLMRLGKLYLLRMAWRDAKAIFKVATKNRDNCSIAW